tara:strand:- start:27219 stop:27893 length:675 start_codon:yes stop_codon:yes gene_type:complete
MRIAIIQHEPNEWIGSMLPWFEAKGAQLSTCMVYLGEPLPSIGEFDWLLIMGGNMSVYEELKYLWLIDEKQLIRDAISADKKVLGICLGGQLIASALGAAVYAGQQHEIGWFEVIKTHPVASWCPDKFQPLSWHGDRFDLPAGVTGFAKSDITPNQGFCLSNKVWALQFHLEVTVKSVADFHAVCDHTLPEGRYVQTSQKMLDDNHVAASKPVMHALLDVIEAA